MKDFTDEKKESNNFKPRILYPAKLSFTIEGEPFIINRN
jgi:hypothetical protein